MMEKITPSASLGHTININIQRIKIASMATRVNWLIIGSRNGFTPVWHQGIIWSNARLLSTGPFIKKIEIGTNMQKLYISSHIKDSYCGHFLWNCSRVMITRHSRLLVNAGSDYGSSGNKPLTEPVVMMHMVSLDADEIIHWWQNYIFRSWISTQPVIKFDAQFNWA